MIRAIAHAEGTGKPIVLLGLAHENLSRVREGQPIRVNLRNLVPGGEPIEELPDVDIVIFFEGAPEMRTLAEAARRSGEPS